LSIRQRFKEVVQTHRAQGLGYVRAGRVATELYIVRNRIVKYAHGLLRKHDAPAHRLIREGVEVAAVYKNLTGLRLIEFQQQVDNRRLSDPGRSADGIASADLENCIETVQYEGRFRPITE